MYITKLLIRMFYLHAIRNEFYNNKLCYCNIEF